VVGADKRTDVALIKIDAADLPAVRMGDPARLKVGEWVVAIGSFMEREALTQESPDTYVVTDHYRDYPMKLVVLDDVPGDELRELLIESWRRRAPKKLLAEFDGP
jgi:hypothetical protein